MRALRVLHLTRDFPPRHCGGMSTAVGGLVAAQAAAGLAVAVVSFDAWRPRRGNRQRTPTTATVQHDGVTVLRVRDHADLDAAIRLGRDVQPSILHVHDGAAATLASHLRAAGQAAIVHTAHVLHQRQNELRGSGERTISLAAQEQALAAADRVIAPSHAARAALVATYPALDAKLRIAAHGIADSAAARAAAARHRQHPCSGPLLAVGRFADVKGTAELFTALILMLRRVPHLTVVVAGGVPGNARADRRWRARWRAEAPAALQGRVAFPGWLDAGALAHRYADAAAVLIPSRYESFGLVALEAMLHGAPVTATDAGALPELVVHGVNGLSSPVGNVTALAENALTLLTDAPLARRLSIAAAARARAYRWQHTLPRVLDVYNECRST